MRKRLDENIDDTRVLEAKVAELERWRFDLEDRFKEERDSTTDRFSQVHRRIDVFKKEFKEEFDTCAGNRERNNTRYDEIKNLLNDNELDHSSPVRTGE